MSISDNDLVNVICNNHTDRIRYCKPEFVPYIIRESAAKTNLHIADFPVLTQGRIELLWYYKEQSISIDYHRYGNLYGGQVLN